MGDTYIDPDNLLGLKTFDEINIAESEGVANAYESFIMEQEVNVSITPELILNLHQAAFGHLYKWAGKYRKTELVVGQLIPPKPGYLNYKMYEFCEQVEYFRNHIQKDDKVKSITHCLAYAHAKFIEIHPFLNGNGRTARMLTDLISITLGLGKIECYKREEGDERKQYIDSLVAIQKNNDYSLLYSIIGPQVRYYLDILDKL
ncbi:Fic family protein [Solitalea sp. MAHUQ-68]|uniref:Fic family protein n=1 Tax=Solitalea agri TaxID=2953739 RepID=A0A9X2F3Y6_9SPHI|nr:Fic family protein [Solitalea agri]MCO4293856.1 Fic family protein [Solitalea agri]